MLDRELQLRILKALAANYPEATFDVLRDIGANDAAGIANLFYLTEHNLCQSKVHKVRQQSDGLCRAAAHHSIRHGLSC